MAKTSHLYVFVFIAGTAFLGCSSAKDGKTATSRTRSKPPVNKEEPAAVPSASWQQSLGRISLVNPDMGFVLVDIGTAPAPEPGSALKSYSGGVVSGDLVVSTYQRRPFLIGDIVAGAPKVGDSLVLFTRPPQTDAKMAAPSLKAFSKEQVEPRRLTPEPLPRDEVKVEYLPNLIHVEPNGVVPKLENGGVSKTPAGSALSTVSGGAEGGATPPEVRGAGFAAPASEGAVSPRQGAEIIPGIPVIRKRQEP
jgi:hypothetical protein